MRILRITIAIATIFPLLLPHGALAKRPPKKESFYISDIIKKGLDLEKEGKASEAEDVFLELYESIKGKKFREEHEWLAYMKVLRNLISFYYRQADYKEADWYHREYSDELEDDQDESGMHAMIVYDVMGIAEGLIKEGKFQRAEETFLYLNDRLEDRLGYKHWLVRLVYKNIISLYIQMNNNDRAQEFSRKLNPETP